jgi:hypothetical protein
MSERILKVKPRNPSPGADPARRTQDALTALAGEAPMVRLNAAIPERLRQRLRALQEDRLVQDIIRELVEEYLARR